jgi:hypothetical protein
MKGAEVMAVAAREVAAGGAEAMEVGATAAAATA